MKKQIVRDKKQEAENTIEKKTRKHIAIACVLVRVIIFSIYIALQTPPENTTIIAEPPVRTTSPRRAESPFPTRHTAPSDFYRTIIDNNLFRPLGWTLPRPQEPYRLLGTILLTDANTPQKPSFKRPQDRKHIS